MAASLRSPLSLRSSCPLSSPTRSLRRFHPQPPPHLRFSRSAPRLSLRAFAFHRSRPSPHLPCRFPLRCAPDDSGYLSTGTTDEAEGDQADGDADVSKGKNETTKNAKDDVLGASAGVSEAGQKDDYKQSAEKLVEVLRDTTEQLKEQAEKAKSILVVTAQETVAVIAETAQGTAERSKENLSYIAENAPDPIKEIAETALKAHSTEAPKKFAKIHDFCLGIPYGALLVTGGIIWFIISGSTAAIRFGVILGGILLALSISSLKSWKEGKSSSFYIKGQAAISSIIMLREIRRFFEVKAFSTALIALVSAGMLGFYGYVFLAGGNPPPKKSKLPSEG